VSPDNCQHPYNPQLPPRRHRQCPPSPLINIDGHDDVRPSLPFVVVNLPVYNLYPIPIPKTRQDSLSPTSLTAPTTLPIPSLPSRPLKSLVSTAPNGDDDFGTL
jgi:hypothetical protein